MSVRDEIEKALEQLKSDSSETLPRQEAISMVESLIRSIASDNSDKKEAIATELKDAIHTMRQVRKGMGFKPSEFGIHELPNAHDELDEVVAATEQAANTIMDATESIQTAAETVTEAEAKDKIMEESMRIFEASNFQDITGQRITKVIKTMQNTESGMVKLLESMGYSEEEIYPLSEREVSIDDPESLLNGPGMTGEANSQDDIDAILASFD